MERVVFSPVVRRSGDLSWEELPERKACRIADCRPGDVINVGVHDEYSDWFIDAGERLREALGAVTLQLTPATYFQPGQGNAVVELLRRAA